jgi:hypothetical protein
MVGKGRFVSSKGSTISQITKGQILFQTHLFKPTNGINNFKRQLLHIININNRWWLLFSLLQGHFNSCAPIIPTTIKQLSSETLIMQTHCFHQNLVTSFQFHL